MAEAPRYEPSQLSRAALLAGAAVLLAVLISASAIALLLAHAWWPGPQLRVEHVEEPAQLPTPPAFTGARLDPALSATRARVEARWRARATTYAPLAAEPEAARIPIERAIELMCEPEQGAVSHAPR